MGIYCQGCLIANVSRHPTRFLTRRETRRDDAECTCHAPGCTGRRVRDRIVMGSAARSRRCCASLSLMCVTDTSSAQRRSPSAPMISFLQIALIAFLLFTSSLPIWSAAPTDHPLQNTAKAVETRDASPNKPLAVTRKSPVATKSKPAPAPRSAGAQAPRALTSQERFTAQRKLEAKRHLHAPDAVPSSTQPSGSPSAANGNASISLKPPIARATEPFGRTTSFGSPYSAYASAPATNSVVIAPTSIDAQVLSNLRAPLTVNPLEMGDLPARSTSLCGDGKIRRLGDLDARALAQSLPDFNVVRPRSVCLRRKSLIADYAFR